MSPSSGAGVDGEMFGFIPKLMQFRKQAHSQMIENLSVDSRCALSESIGQLAVARAPSIKSAADSLDDKLTAEERKVIAEASVELEDHVRRATQALVQAIVRSGEPYHFGNSPMPSMTFESPGLTLLALSLEEVITDLNRTSERNAK